MAAPSGSAPQAEATQAFAGAGPDRSRTMLVKSTFPLGRIFITASAQATLAEQDVHDGLLRHAARDWGDVDAHDRRLNDHAVEHGERLLSAYLSKSGEKFWIISEWDRSATTVLLPADY
ncbi:MAG: hypothetical protein ACO1SV_08155 [Fimbriimonas sp.]